MTDTTIQPPPSDESAGLHPIIESYRLWVDTLAGYMTRAAGLLDNLYSQQDQTIEQLRALCARTRSLRRSDFDAIFGQVLKDRRRTRDSLGSLVAGYRAGQDALLREVHEMFAAGTAEAVRAWPVLEERLVGEKDNGAGEIVAALRQVHVEQEKISAALAGLLHRGDKLKIDDLKAVVQGLASRDSRDSAELAALLAVCESAGLNAAMKWRRLAG